MIWFVGGIGAAIALLVLLNWWAHAPTSSARNMALGLIVGLCLLLAVALFAAGKGLLAIIPGGYALLRMAAPSALRFFGGKAAKRFQHRQSGTPGRAHTGDMTRAEALEILGLEDGASVDEINTAHRRMIASAHPDKGGSDWMAAKVNTARSVLLDDARD